MKFKPIELSDRDIFLKYIRADISFYNFTNIYMWRKLMNYRYTISDGYLIISDCYKSGDEKYFYPMCAGSSSNDKVMTILSDLKSEAGKSISVRPLSEENAGKIKSMFPNCCITEHRNLFDYVYNSSDLISLSGHKYHAKKNHFNSFINSYDYEYISINRDNISLLRNASDKLYRKTDDETLRSEYEAVIELEDNFSYLGLRAAVLTANGNIAAYSIGEKMSPDTALIHVEKADREFAGSYAAINKMFIENEFADVDFINREEDMGIYGLKKAKLSYHPCRFNRVYEAMI